MGMGGQGDEGAVAPTSAPHTRHTLLNTGIHTHISSIVLNVAAAETHMAGQHSTAQHVTAAETHMATQHSTAQGSSRNTHGKAAQHSTRQQQKHTWQGSTAQHVTAAETHMTRQHSTACGSSRNTHGKAAQYSTGQHGNLAGQHRAEAHDAGLAVLTMQTVPWLRPCSCMPWSACPGGHP